MAKTTIADIAKLMKQNSSSGDASYWAVVQSVITDSSGNTIGYNVSLDESGQTGTAKCNKVVGATVGDQVLVLLRSNGEAVVIATKGGDSDALEAIDTAEEASETATDAMETAEEAKEIAEGAVNNYFWHDNSGAHISLLEKAITNVKNVLIDATGMFIRNGTTILAQFTSNLARIGETSAGHTDIKPSEITMYGNTGTDTLFKTENLMTGGLYRYTETFDTGDKGTTAGTYTWTCTPTLSYSGFVSAKTYIGIYKNIGGNWNLSEDVYVAINALNTNHQIYSASEETDVGTARLTYSDGTFTLTLTSADSSTYRFNRPILFEATYKTTTSTSQTQCGNYPDDEDKVFKVGNGLAVDNKSTAFSVDAGGNSRTRRLSYICSNTKGSIGIPLSSLYVETLNLQTNVSANSVKSCDLHGLEKVVDIDGEEYTYEPIAIVGCYVVSNTNNASPNIVLRGFGLRVDSSGEIFGRARVANQTSNTAHTVTVSMTVLYAIQKSYAGSVDSTYTE